MKKMKPLFAIGVAALLGACGGGSDDTVDAFAGSWLSDCTDSFLVAEAAPTVPLKQKFLFTYTKVNATTLTFVQVSDIYPASGCSGTPLAKHTNTSTANQAVVDGATTVGGAPAHKITVTHGALGGGTSATGTIALNGIIYPGDFFTGTKTHKTLLMMKDRVFHIGVMPPLDAQGYPTEINMELAFTKQ